MYNLYVSSIVWYEVCSVVPKEGEAMPAPASHEDSTMLVEVKDNLVLAFRQNQSL